MLARRIYYSLKPLLPRPLRIALRRIWARRILRKCGGTWPILESAGQKPEGWPGWPDGKQFAFVLTHDVEGPEGLEQVRPLAELEMKLGFRSSFNFVPEGTYSVPPALRSWLAENGFEVGVHDLYHDGRLFTSRDAFRWYARKINRYLKEWNAVGFRAGFMHHNLQWQHDLEILYDASTFDTDPFEPQPDGVNTIFPFWVPAPGAANSEQRTANSPNSPVAAPLSTLNSQLSTNSGYVELPYTLVQDFNLFVVLRQETTDVWKRKLDWIASRGAMALVNIHPDYLQFEGQPKSSHTFPIQLYVDWLEYARERYHDFFWHALPKEVADFIGVQFGRDSQEQRIPETRTS